MQGAAVNGRVRNPNESARELENEVLEPLAVAPALRLLADGQPPRIAGQELVEDLPDF